MEIKRKTVLWGVIVVLFIATLFLTFKIGSGNVDVSTAVQTTQAATTSASSGMVGGC
jgi:hypothetical protein